MIPEDELIRHLLRSEAQAYANITNELDYLIANAPVRWYERWHMRYDRWLYRQKLARVLDLVPEDERAGVLSQGAE